MTPADTVRAALAQLDGAETHEAFNLAADRITAHAAPWLRALLAEHEADLEQAFRAGHRWGRTERGMWVDSAWAAWRERRAAERNKS